jgi:hypothetical protein
MARLKDEDLRTDLALDPLEMGLWTRARAGHDPTGVIAHSDKGVQYLAVHPTQQLAEAGAVASVAPQAPAMTQPWPWRSTRCSRPS